jgi:PAS domain S-box-containing protein
MTQQSKAPTGEDGDNRFRELLEVSPDAIVEVDRNGRIALLNKVTENMFGYTRAELLGQLIETLIPHESQSRHQEHGKKYWASPRTRPLGHGPILHGMRKNGERFPVEISLSPVQSTDGIRVTAIIRDVTERRRAEELISATNRQLEIRNQEVERANRLKSEFLAGMSHELRTPLHTILGFTELLLEETTGPLNEKQKGFLGHVQNDSLHLLELINDILDLSKIEAGRLELRPEHFDAAQALTEVLSSIRPLAAAKSLQLDNFARGSYHLYCDPIRFKEILYNLLSNAVKFTPEHGRIWVEAAPEAEYTSFSVSDTGIGIPEEEHQSVFEKFYQVGSTTKGIREGTGLGLAISRQLVERQGGTIGVQSRPGSGSRFTFSVRAHPGSVRVHPGTGSGLADQA